MRSCRLTRSCSCTRECLSAMNLCTSCCSSCCDLLSLQISCSTGEAKLWLLNS